ncbi:hypothetical protein [Streptomyces hoynatensis]|uniref:hypothetical protein n=1 Tax=Streptomyces hoynatensis TaxID=1141874 RepID=UPI001F4E3006|nr:hypothetical protein [Streptomyces hoynatensis]
MTPKETAAWVRAAARNNADWCAAVCRSHHIGGTFGPRAWSSARRPPAYFPDAVTLRRDAAPADLLPRLGASSRAYAVKDSFAALDLAPHGFAELFAARWIHRRAGLAAPASPALRARPVSTAAGLCDWQRAWHGGERPPDVFRPALLADPAVLLLAFHDRHGGEELAGGAALNRGAGVVGVSNLFASGGTDPAAVWSATVAAAARHFPGLPLVGYEQGDALHEALACGFATLGPLRVWLRHA